MPDRWLVLRLLDPGDEERRALLVECLRGLGARGVQEDPGSLVAHLPPPEEGDLAEVLDRISSSLEAEVGATPPIRVELEWQPHRDWETLWRKGFRVRRVSERIVVSPTWEDPELEPGDLLITLDPGMAFGTAEHATTRGCLRLLDARVEPGDQVADVGAGSGILSIAAALLGAERVLALESDPWAVAAARENVEVNGVEDRVEVRALEVDPGFLPSEPPFDGIVANIETGILQRLLPGFRAGLQPGGWLILSGIPLDEREVMVEEARGSGFRLEAEEGEEGWWAGSFRSTGPEGS